MPAINVTEAQFEELILKEGIVLVDFWAAWCGQLSAATQYLLIQIIHKKGKID